MICGLKSRFLPHKAAPLELNAVAADPMKLLDADVIEG
jgi:hypothetical protein